MKINRNGATRIVLEFKTVVVKIPNFMYSWNHFLRGLLANISEGNIWEWQSKGYMEVAQLLCPVVWRSWGGWVLIMERAVVLTSENSWQTEVTKMCTEHIKHFPGDDVMSNYGILHGKLVKIDYGELDKAPSEYKCLKTRYPATQLFTQDVPDI